MGIQITAGEASQLADGVWTFDMPPHQIRHFGSTSQAAGARSVLLLRACQYDAQTQKLTFNLEDAAPINVGTTSRVIGLSDQADAVSRDGAAIIEVRADGLGAGDREFLRLTKQELSPAMATTAERLLLKVRERSAGDLRRGQTRNFSETPDNFWYAIVQPRVDQLSLTVRGSVEHFEGIAKLEIKDDRGNTRFKVRGEQDIPAALQLIFHAIRKRR